MEEMLSDVLASYLFMAIMLTIIVISYYRMGGGRFDHGTEEENSSAYDSFQKGKWYRTNSSAQYDPMNSSGSSGNLDPKLAESLQVLGLKHPSSLKKIKKRYYKLAKKDHPDNNQGCQESTLRFKKVSVAYDFLEKNYNPEH